MFYVLQSGQWSILILFRYRLRFGFACLQMDVPGSQYSVLKSLYFSPNCLCTSSITNCMHICIIYTPHSVPLSYMSVVIIYYYYYCYCSVLRMKSSTLGNTRQVLHHWAEPPQSCLCFNLYHPVLIIVWFKTGWSESSCSYYYIIFFLFWYIHSEYKF